MVVRNLFRYFLNLITSQWEIKEQIHSQDGRQRKERWEHPSPEIDAQATIDYYDDDPKSIHIGRKYIGPPD